MLACLQWPSHCSLSVQVMPSQRNQRTCTAMHTIMGIVHLLLSTAYPNLEVVHIPLIQVLDHRQHNVLCQRTGAATNSTFKRVSPLVYLDNCSKWNHAMNSIDFIIMEIESYSHMGPRNQYVYTQSEIPYSGKINPAAPQAGYPSHLWCTVPVLQERQ